jgi:hypothetical protein
MMIILLLAGTRRILIVCRAPERIALLFSGVDGAGANTIPCVGSGAKNQHRENKMKQLLKFSAAPVTALLALAFVGMATPAAAAKYEYCRQDPVSGMRSCSYETMEQCQAMSSGRGGSCFRDPFLVDTSAYAYQPKHALSKSVIRRAKKPIENQ